jgi:hypothetical protein
MALATMQKGNLDAVSADVHGRISKEGLDRRAGRSARARRATVGGWSGVVHGACSGASAA